MASFASLYRRWADQPTVSSSELRPAQPASANRKAASKLLSMGRENYSDWDAAFVAPLSATVPDEMGGVRLDQARARFFPQYSRNRLQEWLRSGHILVDGKSVAPRMQVSGGQKIGVTPPAAAPGPAPRAQRMPRKIGHE